MENALPVEKYAMMTALVSMKCTVIARVVNDINSAFEEPGTQAATRKLQACSFRYR
jgi:hypothetical protein